MVACSFFTQDAIDQAIQAVWDEWLHDVVYDMDLMGGGFLRLSRAGRAGTARLLKLVLGTI